MQKPVPSFQDVRAVIFNGKGQHDVQTMRAEMERDPISDRIEPIGPARELGTGRCLASRRDRRAQKAAARKAANFKASEQRREARRPDREPRHRPMMTFAEFSDACSRKPQAEELAFDPTRVKHDAEARDRAFALFRESCEQAGEKVRSFGEWIRRLIEAQRQTQPQTQP